MAHENRTIEYGGQRVNLSQYTRAVIWARDVRCDCGAPERGHAPDCAYIRAADDASDRFGDLWAEAQEPTGRRTYGGHCHVDDGGAYDLQRKGRHMADGRPIAHGLRPRGALAVPAKLYACTLCGCVFADAREPKPTG